LAGGPASFARSSTSSVLLWYASQRLFAVSRTGLSPSMVRLSRLFRYRFFSSRRPQPRDESRFGLFRFRSPLLTESMICLFSSRYLDVSVPWVRSIWSIHSTRSNWVLPQFGFPIQKSPDQHLFASSPEHIAGYHVFRRLSMPRHPPYTLSSLTTFIDHRHD
jgi:hypothetical protein